MASYKIVIAYDGTDYEGWQVQPHGRTVANELQRVFEKVFSLPIKLVGSSRTDAGVHALGQVAHFSSDLDLDPVAMQQAWSNRLPADISIRSLQRVDTSFHSQRNVQEKTYWYHVALARPLPFVQRYACDYHYPIDQKKLYEALQVFVGTHDFRSFCTGYERENTVRTITSIKLTPFSRYGVLRIEVTGPAFLYLMVRRIVGAALMIASHADMDITYLYQALEKKDPKQILPTAPAKGLMLANIVYYT